MELTMSTLRGILAQITSINQRYIVPKQGNFWNPQEQLQKPDTWCAYTIRSNKPRTAPFYHLDENNSANPTNGIVQLKVATIDLQFIGPKSETIAQSVSMWPMRSDVAQAFKQVHGAMLVTDCEAMSANYYQDGNNTVLSWNVTIRVMWYHTLTTGQRKLNGSDLNGLIL